MMNIRAADDMAGNRLLTHHVHAIDGAELERLILGVQDHVDHGADLGRERVVRRDERDALLQPLLEGGFGALNTALDHFAGHQFEALLQVLPKLKVWPMQISNKRL